MDLFVFAALGKATRLVPFVVLEYPLEKEMPLFDAPIVPRQVPSCRLILSYYNTSNPLGTLLQPRNRTVASARFNPHLRAPRPPDTPPVYVMESHVPAIVAMATPLTLCRSARSSGSNADLLQDMQGSDKIPWRDLAAGPTLKNSKPRYTCMHECMYTY